MSDEFEAPVGTIKRRLHVARKRLAEGAGVPAGGVKRIESVLARGGRCRLFGGVPGFHIWSAES